MNTNRKIYLILTQTSSNLSKAIRVFTRDEFNHMSISLTPSLDPMFSFGRLKPYNPFRGGFVKEYIYQGTFYRFPKTRCAVLELEVSEATYRSLEEDLDRMYRQKEIYRYNVAGLFLAAIRVSFVRKDYYYCSEFVKDLFCRNQVAGSHTIARIPQPCDFLAYPGVREIYRGLLQKFPAECVPSEVICR